MAPRDESGADRSLDAARRGLDDLHAASVADSAPVDAGRHAELLAPEAWRAMIDDALARIRGGELDKVVPAAPSLFEAERDIAPDSVNCPF